MAAAAGVFAHSMTAGQALSGTAVTPMDNSSNGTNGSSNSSSDSATISANDFLTLLVTEMQNQDPTATTDPNEYINQLVQVNSLEQLININQTLTTDLGAPTPSSNADAAGSPAASAVSNLTSPASGPAALTAPQSTSRSHALPTQPVSVNAPGNLSIPGATPASQRVAHALERQSQLKPIAGRLNTFEQHSLNRP